MIQVLALSFMPCHGFSVSATTLMGQYIGAGFPDIARKSSYNAIRLGLTYAVLIGIVYIVFPEQLVRIFNSDPAVVSYGKKIVYFAAIFQIFERVFYLEVVSKPQIRFKGPAEAGLHI